MFCGKEKEKKQRRFERKKNKTIIRCDIGWTRKKKSVRSSIKYHAMLACGGVEIGFHALLTSALGIGASQSGRRHPFDSGLCGPETRFDSGK